MLFDRIPKCPAFEDTRRKRLAVLRGQKKKIERAGLFGPIVAETLPTVDDVMAQRALDDEAFKDAMRDRSAQSWRAIRARFYALPLAERGKIRLHLQNSRLMPRNSGIYAYLIREAEAGRMDEHLAGFARAVEIGRLFRTAHGIEPATDDERAQALKTLAEISAQNREHFKTAPLMDAAAEMPRRQKGVAPTIQSDLFNGAAS